VDGLPREKGWSADQQAFVQQDGSGVLDSSLLRMSSRVRLGSAGTFSLSSLSTSTRLPGRADGRTRLAFEKMLTHANHVGPRSPDEDDTGGQRQAWPPGRR
jgi:hypothetical protein